MPDLKYIDPLVADLYRATAEYDYQPQKLVPNPNFVPGSYMNTNYDADSWMANMYVNDGPVQRKTLAYGPVTEIKHIKGWVTRERNSYTNFQLVKIEKVSAWEEVEF